MKFTSKVLLTLSALSALVVSVGSCGGNSANLSNDEGSAFVGITQGDFKAVRYNDAGYRDGSLNSTIDLNVADQGNTTVVTVSISDSGETRGVTLDLKYDAEQYSPANVNFNGLIDTPVEMSHTGIAGLVALGQVDTKSTAVRHGQFATVVFEHRAFNGSKSILAVHSDALDSTYTANSTNASAFAIAPTAVDDSNPAVFTIRSLFATGDGNGDGESNISDLTPIGVNFGKTVAPADLYPANSDYDHNGEVNISDLTPLGAHFGQNTSAIEIMIGDDDTTGTVLETLNWGDGTAATGNPNTPTADPNAVWRTWTGDVTLAEGQSADANTDNIVFVSARATDGTTPGTAFTGIAINLSAPPDNFVISGMDVQIVGATGGSGTTAEDFLDGDTAVVTANSALTLNITGISGTYNAAPFTPADAGGAVPQSEYDDALAAVIGLTNWTTSTTGAAGMRATAEVLALSAATGSNINVTVFPDDDPDSIAGGTTEGTLAASAGPSGAFIPGTLSVNVDVDVTADATAPIANGIAVAPDNGLDGNGDALLSVVANSEVSIPFDWGSGGAPGSINETTIGCSLYNFEAADDSDPFTFVAGDPASAGEFTVLGTGPYLLKVLLSPSMLAQGNHYGIRILDISAGNVYNSCNKPGNFLAVAPPPAAEELVFYPETGLIGPGTNQITCLWPDPVLRRDPEVVIDITDGSIDPDRPNGFNDIIKTSGNEFQVAGITGSGEFPKVTFIMGNDPSSIGANTDDQDVLNQAIIISERDPDRIVVNIQAMPGKPASISDPPTDYAFKFFGVPAVPGDNGTRPAIGFGTFAVEFQPLAEANITAVDWGINIFSSGSRGDLALAARDFSDKTADSATFVAADSPAAPDVFFVEFSGGIVGSDFPDDNVKLKFHRQSDDSEYVVPLRIVCAGLGGGGLNYIGLHVFSDVDLIGSAGNLAAAESYDLSVRDGNDAGDTALTTALFVQ